MSSPPRWLPALGAVLWSVWILQLGLDERQQVVGLSASASEAVQHIVAFAVLGALVMATVRKWAWAVFAAVAAAGVLGEVIQLTASDRTFSIRDMVFSVLGGAIGVAVGVVVARWRGWSATIAIVSLAGLIYAMAPVVLEIVVPGPRTSYSADCAPAPPAAPGAPVVVLSEEIPPALDGDWPLEIDEPSAAELRSRLLATNELSATIEFSTTDLDQSGPVRLLTISDGTAKNRVNFHIGLEGDDLSIRLRTSCELFNSIMVRDVVQVDTAHRVDVTWGEGTLAVWVDGVEATRETLSWGDFERWDPSFPILVGDESGGGRRFDGSILTVTMWDHALDEAFIVAEAASG